MFEEAESYRSQIKIMEEEVERWKVSDCLAWCLLTDFV